MRSDIPQVRLTDALHVARSRNASDVHLSPGLAPVIRVDGDLQFLGGSPLEPDDTRAMARELLDESRLEQIDRGEDVSATWSGTEEGLVRIHAFRSVAGVVLALRLLSEAIPVLEELHLPAVVATFCERRRGLILFCGPTGSGKTTSLAAFIDRINRTSARRIVTIEDPIEYRHFSKRSLIVQREVGSDAHSFSSALIGALRADPDVIMVGEMRDAMTMQAALTAAETGHLVLATLHTGDAAQTIDRIIDVFPDREQSQIRTQLSQVLVAVVCQHLVRRATRAGRRVVAEVLIATDAVRTIIREARTHQLRNVMLTGRHLGMQTLEHHLAELLAQCEIEREAVTSIGARSDEMPDAATVPVS